MIVGHEKQIRFLKQMVQQGNIPHALLFSGPPKIGKKRVALEMASWLLGEKINSHPDFILLEPEKKWQGKIQIDQIRELSWRLSLKPIRANLIVGIIDDAHLMTRDAQNCFLKTLEEPKSDALLILITSYPSLLLPTIRSRCQEIKFFPLGEKILRKFLEEKNVREKEIEELIQISFGKIGTIIEFLENPKTFAQRKLLIKKLNKFPLLSLFERFQLVKEISQDPKVTEILENWLAYLRYFLLKKAANEKNSFDLSFMRLKKLIEKIQETINLISFANIDHSFALEVLMLDF